MNQPSLSKCGSTLFCYLRTARLWFLVVLVLVLAALRSRIAGAVDQRKQA